MTGPEHYRRAGQVVESVTRRGKGDLEDPIVVSNDHSGTIAAAQVHAVLALAAATALESDRREWLNGKKPRRAAAWTEGCLQVADHLR